MQNIFINVIRHLQYCFVKSPGFSDIIQTDSMFTDKFVTTTNRLLTLYFMLKYYK